MAGAHATLQIYDWVQHSRRTFSSSVTEGQEYSECVSIIDESSIFHNSPRMCMSQFRPSPDSLISSIVSQVSNPSATKRSRYWLGPSRARIGANAAIDVTQSAIIA